MQNFEYDRIREGLDVRDINGEKIGKAGERLGQYFNVDAGFLGTKEYYVPFDAVTDIRDDGVYVNAYKNDLDGMGWDRRPDERTAARESAYAEDSLARGRGTSGETLQLREEELRARTTPVETGRVHVGKEVVEEPRTVDVPVSREEVYIERHPVERRPADAPIGDAESEAIRVPVREEQVRVEKEPVVYEEVGVGKRVTQDTEQVSETVRREELRTDEEGDAELRTDPSARP